MARRTPKKPRQEKKGKKRQAPQAGEKKAWPKAVWVAEAQNFDLARNEHYRQAEQLYRQLLEAGPASREGLRATTLIESQLKRLKAENNEAGLRAFVSYFVARGVESAGLMQSMLKSVDLNEWAGRVPSPKKKKR